MKTNMCFKQVRSLQLNSLILALVLLTSIFSCHDKSIDEDQARKAILTLHDQQKTYHFEKMAHEFAMQLSDNHISVNRGEITSLSREEHIDRFSNYFNAVEFEKWDDINSPIIRFSEDYSLAYTIVDKEVIVNYKDENGDNKKEKTVFSWVAIYKRYDDQWRIDCVASTNKPSEIIE